MQEALLHYLWQFQYFDKENMCTTEGEEIQVFNPGNKNSNAGPDFFNARIKIGNIEWVGSVEIHIHSSGWIEHKHETDPAYENVVLHVVWKNDKPVRRSDGSHIPTIELNNRIDEKLLIKYHRLVNNPATVPCSGMFKDVDELLKISMLDKVLVERIQAKARLILDVWHRNDNDWEETCYQLLCKNFGFKINAEPFFQLAQALPYKLILKHSDKLWQIESLLFGQAGFLDDEHQGDYAKLLKREYNLLQQKYQLSEKKLKKAQWRFLRLRPANFPTIRLAQLASLIHAQKNIFSKIMEGENCKIIKEIFNIKQSAYWECHYQFAKEVKDVPALGEVSIDNILINTVTPLLVAYSISKDEQVYMDRAIDILQNIKAENNTVTRQWVTTGLKCKTAFESQALLELNNNFCLRRRCLDCNIGISLVNPASR